MFSWMTPSCGGKKIDPKILQPDYQQFGKMFAEDLRRLEPLANHRKNLLETTADFSDDLVMQVDELLNPTEELQSDNQWKQSRYRFCAVIEIIKRLNNLGQPDLISVCLSQLDNYAQMYELSKPSTEKSVNHFALQIEYIKLTSTNQLGSSLKDKIDQIQKTCKNSNVPGQKYIDHLSLKVSFLKEIILGKNSDFISRIETYFTDPTTNQLRIRTQ